MKIPSISFPYGTPKEMWDFYQYSSTILNSGRYQLNVLTDVPTYNGDDGEMVAVNKDATNRAIYIFMGDTWYNVNFVSGTTSASNTGSTGTGVFKQQTGSTLEFYKLASADNKLDIALNGTDYIRFTINQGNIDHDQLTNFLANEHIDWTNASQNFLTTGSATANSISTGEFDVDSAGDAYWTGDSTGLPYGSCYGNDIAWAQASAAQNTWYNIADTDMTDGELNLVTHDGSGKLTVTKAGRYLINYGLCAESSVANSHIETGIEVSGSGSANNAGINHFEFTAANAELPVSCTAILDLAANATIEIAIRTTDATTPNITVAHLNISVVMVGGT